ncbi:MAG: TrbI/VirB10 family protein [Bacteriovoracia bacterium]
MKSLKWKVSDLTDGVRAKLKKLKENLYIQDGQKRRLNGWFIALMGIPLLITGALVNTFWERKDTSYLAQSSDVPKISETEPEKTIGPGNQNSHSSVVLREESAMSSRTVSTGMKLRYSAKQVIDRFSGMPAGTNFIGKLITGIDTRDPSQMVKVALPYGVVYQGSRNIERGAALMGSAQYTGNGDKVFIRFNRLINTDGTEYPVQAQALNSRDFTAGISGDLNTNMDSRMMAAMGLKMIAAGSDVLVEKESLGNSFQPTPKSSLKNAAIAGVSEATEMEAERRLSQAGSQEDYVIVEPGVEMIISLMEPFRGEARP